MNKVIGVPPWSTVPTVKTMMSIFNYIGVLSWDEGNQGQKKKQNLEPLQGKDPKDFHEGQYYGSFC